MANILSDTFRRFVLRKNVHEIIAESQDPNKSLKKSLGALDLTILGVGAIIGAGIFVYAGLGARVAGPHIIWSFVLVGAICALAGLAYAELASAIPTSGSAYAYTYTILGETVGWMLGWALVLEYAVGAAAVAMGWSSNFVALIRGLTGWQMPTYLRQSAWANPDGGFVNLPAILIVALVSIVLVIGSKESARFAAVFVAAKIAVIAVVVGVGVFFLNGGNWALTPPPSDPGAWYAGLGAIGPILAGGAIIFFAYIGFDAVSTTAEETRNPKRDLPIGILGSLAICTVLYILASLVLLGMIPYTDLSPDCALDSSGACIVGNGVTPEQAGDRIGEPFGYAFESNGITWAANLIRFGAVVGITSVIMVLLMGGPRVFFALARDGLLPQSWSRVHPRFGTPYRTTIGTAAGVAAFAGFGRLDFAGEVTNIGTLFAFVLVSVGVIVLRYTHPDLNRPFRMPWSIGRFPILAVIGAVACLALMFALDPNTQLSFFAWMGLGLVVYGLYGIHRSRLLKEPSGEPGRVGGRRTYAPLERK